MMRIINSLLLVFLFSPFILANSLQARTYIRGFSINGHIEGLEDGTKVYLIQYSTKDTVSIARSQKGQFLLTGRVPKGTEYYYIEIDSTLDKKRSSEFLLVNANLVLKGEYKEWPQVNLIGSKPNDEYKNFASLWNSYDIEFHKLDSIKQELFKESGIYRTNIDSNKLKDCENKISQIDNRIDELAKRRIEQTKIYIKKHKNSLYISDLIRRMGKAFSLSELENFYAELNMDARQSYFGELLYKDIEISKKRLLIREGTVIPDIKVRSITGDKISLREIASRSELTLIDFWASWCRPCRQQIPKIKAVYEKFKGKGFNVLGVAVYDDEAAWKTAIKTDDTKWLHARDYENMAYKTFDIPAIPGYALVNKEGRIISFSCSGSAVKEFGPPIRGDSLEITVAKLLQEVKNIDSLASIGNIKPLKIGEKVPDLYLGELVNHPDLKKAHISDFKGKLLILDFWSTWCAVCIAQFPKITKLQEEFGEKIAIIPVGFDVTKIGSIKEYIEKNRGKEKGLQLPCAIQHPQDSLLSKYFPFFGLPHEIWISSSGNLIGITDHRAITDQNIRAVLDGQIPSFSVKKVTKRIFKYDRFLFNNIKSNLTVYGSAFAPYCDTLSTATLGFVYLKEPPVLRYVAHNQTAHTLYKEAYSQKIQDIDEITNSKIILNNSETEFYKDFDVCKEMNNWQYDEFARKNLFSVELSLPSSYSIPQANDILIQTLDKFLNVESKIIKHKVKCLVLTKVSRFEKLDKVQPKITEVLDENSYSNLINYIEIRGDNDISFLIKQLKYFIPTEKIIIDETNIKGKIHITLKNNNLGLEDIRKQLKYYNLDLIERSREIEMLQLKRKHS